MALPWPETQNEGSFRYTLLGYLHQLLVAVSKDQGLAACQGETVSKRGKRPPASPSEAMQGGEKELTSQIWLTVHSFPPSWLLGLFWSEFQGPELAVLVQVRPQPGVW